MKEHPILFSAPMVRALLDGTKTQTRRTVKRLHPDAVTFAAHSTMPSTWWVRDQFERILQTIQCPYGQPGDRLWVRETHQFDAPVDGTWPATAFYGCKGAPISLIPERFRHPAYCLYEATWLHGPIKWRPSIHMPRWASRILLEIVSVRVERLQDINEEDALAEGIEKAYVDTLKRQRWKMYDHTDGVPGEDIARYVGPTHTLHPIESYKSLWLGINGAGSWDANPWVWVIEFRRI